MKGGHYGLGGQIIKNAKGHKKTQAACPKLRKNSGQTRGIKRNSVKLTIIQF